MAQPLEMYKLQKREIYIFFLNIKFFIRALFRFISLTFLFDSIPDWNQPHSGQWTEKRGFPISCNRQENEHLPLKRLSMLALLSHHGDYTNSSFRMSF